MHKITYRVRNQSISDTHILQCGCTHCDGSGWLMHEGGYQEASYTECPQCEGLGYLPDYEMPAHSLPTHAQVILFPEKNVQAPDPVKQAA